MIGNVELEIEKFLSKNLKIKNLGKSIIISVVKVIKIENLQQDRIEVTKNQ